MRRAWRGLASVALVVAALSMLMSAWLFKLNQDRVDQINAERATNIVRNCDEVNARHDKTLQTLDAILARRLESAAPSERARLRESRETTALLIEALVPRRDCAALVARQVTK